MIWTYDALEVMAQLRGEVFGVRLSTAAPSHGRNESILIFEWLRNSCLKTRWLMLLNKIESCFPAMVFRIVFADFLGRHRDWETARNVLLQVQVTWYYHRLLAPGHLEDTNGAVGFGHPLLVRSARLSLLCSSCLSSANSFRKKRSVSHRSRRTLSHVIHPGVGGHSDEASSDLPGPWA